MSLISELYRNLDNKGKAVIRKSYCPNDWDLKGELPNCNTTLASGERIAHCVRCWDEVTKEEGTK